MVIKYENYEIYNGLVVESYIEISIIPINKGDKY